MNIINPIPNYFFISYTAVETNRVISKLFENVKKINLENAFLKNSLFVGELSLRSILVISVVGLTLSYPLIATICLLATRFFYPTATNTSEVQTVPLHKADLAVQTIPLPKADLAVQTETLQKEVGIQTLGDIDWGLDYLQSLEEKLEILTKKASNLPEAVSEIIKDLSNTVGDLKTSIAEEKDPITALEKKLCEKLQNLMKKSLENLRGKFSSLNIKSDLETIRKLITLHLPIVEILINFMEFQKNSPLLEDKKALVKLLEHMHCVLDVSRKSDSIDTYFVMLRLELSYIRVPFNAENIESTVDKNNFAATCPTFLTEFTYRNTQRLEDRKPIMKEILVKLNQRKLGSLILVGKAGSGKTTMVESLIDKASKLSKFKKCKFYKLDATALIAGACFVGSLERRVTQMLQFFNSLQQEDKDSKIIVVVDEIHLLSGMGATTDSKNDVWQSLKEELGNSTFTMIGTTTKEEYQKYIEKDTAVKSRFSIIEIPDITKDEQQKILQLKAREYLDTYNLTKVSEDELIHRVKTKILQETLANSGQDVNEFAEKLTEDPSTTFVEELYETYTNCDNIREIIKHLENECSRLELQEDDEFVA